MNASANAVIFDWNGTLLADTQCCWRATNSVLKHLGKKLVTLDDYRTHHTIPFADMYKTFGCDAQELTERRTEIQTVWNGAYDEQSQAARLRRGARGMLTALQEMQYRALILSNHTIANISGHTKRLGVHDCFEAILANDKVGGAFLRKSKGERLPDYAQQNGYAKAIIVGDSVEEIEIARENNIVSVALSGGVYSTKRLRAAKPDFLIHNLTEIPAIAQHVFGPTKRGK